MRADERILELKKRIIDYHGRVEDIHIYNKDPYPARDPKTKMHTKVKNADGKMVN